MGGDNITAALQLWRENDPDGPENACNEPLTPEELAQVRQLIREEGARIPLPSVIDW